MQKALWEILYGIVWSGIYRQCPRVGPTQFPVLSVPVLFCFVGVWSVVLGLGQGRLGVVVQCVGSGSGQVWSWSGLVRMSWADPYLPIIH